MTDLSRAALAYAAKGWPVFPVWGLRTTGDRWACRCSHGPACASPGKHPHAMTPNGFHEATTDPEQIAGWWARDRSANVALVCGVVFDVLDVDNADFREGVADLPDCETEGGPVVRTGSGKWHLYFAATGIARKIGIAAKVDWLGVGGYCIAPPSRHVTGGLYEWFASDTLALTRPPRPLLDLLDPPVRYSQPPRRNTTATHNGHGPWSPAGLYGKMATAVEGQRNAMLHWCAVRIGEDVDAGKVSEDDAVDALNQLAQIAETRGLGHREITATIRSGYQA